MNSASQSIFGVFSFIDLRACFGTQGADTCPSAIDKTFYREIKIMKWMAQSRQLQWMQNTWFTVSLVVILGFVMGGGNFASAKTRDLPIHPNTKSQSKLVNLPNFTPIINRVGDAVVNISSTSSKVVHAGPHNPFPPNSPFHQFFRHFMAPGGPGGGQHHEKVTDLGSGFILSPNGYIVTAGHVVRHASHIVVTLTNHHAYPAKLVGLSVRYDTALLKINAHHLPTAPIGNSSDLKVGQWLLAVGAPFGFYNTVTQGVVSAVNRSLPHDDEYIPFIQSDVPINPGNSGGPLFNMKGQVVGINDQIYTNSGGYMGLSFSIPINTVMHVVHDFKQHKPVQFGWLGVEVQDVSTQMAKALNLKEPVGALVASIAHNSPAAKAGVKPGDVIVTFNGKPVESVGQLPPMVGNTLPGTKVTIGILRNGKAKTLHATVGVLPQHGQGRGSSAGGSISKLHIQVQALTSGEMKHLGIKHGVLVIGVGNGPAARAGISPGMAILDIAGKSIHSPKQLRHIVNNLPAGRSIAVRVREGRHTLFTAIRLSSNG